MDPALMKSFLSGMSREEKVGMMQEFMNSLSDEEKGEMARMMLPVMMKEMKPSMMMAGMMEHGGGWDCEKMLREMPPEMRSNCKKMMGRCLKVLQDMEDG